MIKSMTGYGKAIVSLPNKSIVIEIKALNSKYFDFVSRIPSLYKEKEPIRYIDSEKIIKPQWVIEQTGKMLGDTAIISTDVGQHQMWTAQFYPFGYPRQFLTSGGLGTMGVGLPYAMGAKRANKDKISINFSGDGSIMMNIQELLTCFQYELPIINIVLNNRRLGMVRQWQTFFYGERFAETLLDTQPDFILLAKSMGGVGYQVHTKSQFDIALKDAIASNRPAIIDVIVDKDENVFPMVPNGHALNDMMLLEGDKR